MGVRSFLSDLVNHWGANASSERGLSVNPATGLPMLGGGIDMAGNPYGTDLRQHDDAGSPSSSGVDHQPLGSPISNDWSSSSWSGASTSWPDHSSSISGYDSSRGW